MEMITHYWSTMLEHTPPFLLAWEAYVFFMLCFFVSIVFRLNRIERKLNKLIYRKKRWDSGGY